MKGTLSGDKPVNYVNVPNFLAKGIHTRPTREQRSHRVTVAECGILTSTSPSSTGVAAKANTEGPLMVRRGAPSAQARPTLRGQRAYALQRD